ncbi:hypothetical protein HNR60_001753 [Rhodopseudomonas rhenobacensis]|uniref:Uncharacterized protein n=1 Tax=Rhodopseudomonas rhenobacensis TaxID=87461 RepID=A0A7W8DZM1_9BRAD|nr:hypothetical protein [Rhodopseudomonas rhenobacensis]
MSNNTFVSNITRSQVGNDNELFIRPLFLARLRASLPKA